MTEKHCNAFRSSWPWKGYRCCNEGQFEHDGKWYCHAHIYSATKGKYDAVKWEDRKGEE